MNYKDLLEEVLSKQEGLVGLKVEEVAESACTQPGDNFMSVVSAVTVTGTLPGGTKYSGSVFMKRPPDSARYLQDYGVDKAFSNEVVVYLQVMPLYRHTLPCATCYHADPEVILLEDLRRHGYCMIDRRTGFDHDTIKLVLKAISKFHAASYHTRIMKKKEFSKATDLLVPIGFILSSNKDMVEGSMRRAIELLSGQEGLEEVVLALKSHQGRVSKTLLDLRKVGSVPVLCHGDFWINNIMVRVGGEDPIRLVDLQACAILSPAVDVWSLLYTSVETHLVEDVDRLLRLYCESFIDYLSSFNVPPEHIPSFSELLKELQGRELYGFVLATISLPALYINFQSIPNMAKEQHMDDKIFYQLVGREYKDRVCQLANYCKNRGVFRVSSVR